MSQGIHILIVFQNSNIRWIEFQIGLHNDIDPKYATALFYCALIKSLWLHINTCHMHFASSFHNWLSNVILCALDFFCFLAKEAFKVFRKDFKIISSTYFTQFHTYRISSYSFRPWIVSSLDIVSAPVCTVTKGHST